MNRIAVLVLIVTLAACGDGSGGDKYKQTWAKAYSATTCADWTGTMDAHQRFAMSADMLVGMYRAKKPGADLPSDTYVDRLVSAVTSVCAAAPTESVTSVAASLYTLANDLGPD